MSLSAWVRTLTEPSWYFFIYFFISLPYTFSDILLSVNEPGPEYLLKFAKSKFIIYIFPFWQIRVLGNTTYFRPIFFALV